MFLGRRLRKQASFFVFEYALRENHLFFVVLEKILKKDLCCFSPSHSLSADISCAFVCFPFRSLFSFCGAMTNRNKAPVASLWLFTAAYTE